MRGVIRLSPADWRQGAGGVRAAIAVPFAARCAVRAEGWADPALARLVPARGAPVPFAPAGEAAFAWVEVEAGEMVALDAPTVPRACHLAFHPAGGRSALAHALPRAVAAAPAAAPQDLAAVAASLEDALERPEPDTALAILAAMLIAARGAPETEAAARAVLRQAARRPLWRSPAFGALAAALAEEEARSAWP